MGEEPQAEPLTLDDTGSAQATGALDPQGMASYVVELAGAVVRAIVTHRSQPTATVLTVVEAAAIRCRPTMPVPAPLTRPCPSTGLIPSRVINFGDVVQEYTFDLAVGDPQQATLSWAVPIEQFF